MAIEYDFYLSRPVTPQEALATLLPTAARTEVRPDLVQAEADGVLVSAVGEHENQQPPSVVDETYDLHTRLRMSFRLDKLNQEMARQTMIRLVNDALGRWTEDAVLLFNGERPILLRRKGQLTLNSAAGFWRQQGVLALIDAPFDERELPNL
jgi:hypothetical protein